MAISMYKGILYQRGAVLGVAYPSGLSHVRYGEAWDMNVCVSQEVGYALICCDSSYPIVSRSLLWN